MFHDSNERDKEIELERERERERVRPENASIPFSRITF